MKVLFSCLTPFSLAHGGAQIQIEQTKQALENLGVTVEFLRWWDDRQSGDILHHFGRVPVIWLKLAQAKGMKVIQSDLLTAQGSRPLWRHHLHQFARAGLQTIGPQAVVDRIGWESYQLADANVALTSWEAFIMSHVFGAPARRVHVIPNGVESVFLQSPALERGTWLVCTATVTPRKRVLELAEAAVVAKTPLWIIGKAYAAADTYAQRFETLCKQYPAILRYEGAISERNRLAEIYASARGFVLLSTMESLSLSALEAAACRCPLLLSDLPWARCVFGDLARYCPVTNRSATTARVLEDFYRTAPQQLLPDPPLSWREVAQQLQRVYEEVAPGDEINV